jgi:hypothetical protein
MTLAAPEADCHDVGLPGALSLPPPAQVALEDYARVLTGARAAEVIETPAAEVTGVHLCAPGLPLSPQAIADIAGFARELAAATPSGGLGWS